MLNRRIKVTFFLPFKLVYNDLEIPVHPKIEGLDILVVVEVGDELLDSGHVVNNGVGLDLGGQAVGGLI